MRTIAWCETHDVSWYECDEPPGETCREGERLGGLPLDRDEMMRELGMFSRRGRLPEGDPNGEVIGDPDGEMVQWLSPWEER